MCYWRCLFGRFHVQTGERNAIPPALWDIFGLKILLFDEGKTVCAVVLIDCLFNRVACLSAKVWDVDEGRRVIGNKYEFCARGQWHHAFACLEHGEGAKEPRCV